MFINNENFPVYITDTVGSIIRRIATRMKTVPRFLIIQPELQAPFEENYSVTNLLDQIAYQDDLKPNFAGVKDRKEAEGIFVATNKVLTGIDEDDFRRVFFLQLASSFENDVPRLWENRNQVIKSLEKEISDNKKLTDKTTARMIEFERIPMAPHSEISLSQMRFTINLGPCRLTIEELFNDIRLTPKAPYSNMGSLYKVFQDFIPNYDWTGLQAENVILVKVDGELSHGLLRELKNPYKKYTNAVFGIENGDLLVTMDVNTSRRNVSRQEFIERALSIFPNSFTTNIQKDEMVIGYFVLQNQTLDVPVFAELTMNNELFYDLSAIDESIRASKSKQNVYLHILNSTDTMSFHVKHTKKMSEYGMDEDGTPYVRVRVKSKSKNDAIRLQQLLARWFTIYNNERTRVIDMYRKYLPDFLTGPKVTVTTKEKRKLREIAPDIFFPTYSRKCLNRPTIVPDDYDPEGQPMMRFPIYGESKPRNYICDHKNYPYPGLRENQLQNKDKFPFVPCCYSKNQEERKGSKYRGYFFREEHHDKTPQPPRDVFISSKILPQGVIGLLPKKIRDLFDSLDPTSKYVRIGTRKSPLSFLDAILTGQRKQKYDTKKVLLEMIPLANAAKQELYDRSEMEIVELMTEEGGFLPTNFVHLVEVALDCNIYVFTDQPSEGNMVIPPHLKAYYKFAPSKETFFVFQHKGSEADHALYPQTELIVRIINEDKQILGFTPNDPIVQGINRVHNRLCRAYLSADVIEQPQLRKLSIESQLIDSYGKCRVINVKSGNKIFSIVTDPLPPFGSPLLTTFYRQKGEDVAAFIESIDAKVISKRMYNNEIREVNIILPTNVKGTVLVDGGIMNKIPIAPGIPEYDAVHRQNLLHMFKHDNRASKLLVQYALFLLSEFGSDDLVKFSDERITVDNAYHYDLTNVGSKFTVNNPFIRDGKIVVPNYETQKRLLFVLGMFLSTKRELVNKYKSMTTIPEFFADLSDYTYVKTQNLIEGKKGVADLIRNYQTDQKISKAVKPEKVFPYFLYVNKVSSDTNVFLAQNFLQRKDAEQAVKYWHYHGYNPQDDNINPIDDQQIVTTYLYENEKQFVPVGSVNDFYSGGSVFAYKYQGQPIYTALMPILETLP